MTTNQLEFYQNEVDRLARSLGCRAVQSLSPDDGMHYVEFGYIVGPLIRNQQNYLANLHELGHFAFGHTQGRPPHQDQRFYFDNGVLRSEAQAWEWAMNECCDAITYKSRRFMWDYCLGSYYQDSLAMNGARTRLSNGDRHHVEFAYDQPDAYFTAIVERIQDRQEGFVIPYGSRTLGPWGMTQLMVERYLHTAAD